MPSSTRLDKETELVLQKAANYLGTTKSEIVRDSVRQYCEKILQEKKHSPWKIYQSIHKPGGSGHGERVQKSREMLMKKLEMDRKKWSS